MSKFVLTTFLNSNYLLFVLGYFMLCASLYVGQLVSSTVGYARRCHCEETSNRRNVQFTWGNTERSCTQRYKSRPYTFLCTY